MFYLAIFTFGLLIGSFLNVVIYRLHSGESIFKARSRCTKCGHVLTWYELVPILSFIVQGGKCRACSAPISFQYPLVELGTAILFMLIIFNFSPYGGSPVGGQFSIFNEFSNFQIFKLCYLLIIASLLIIIFFFDLKYYIIPDKIIYPAIGISFLYTFLVFLKLNHWSLFENWKLSASWRIENLETLYIPILAALAASAFFATIFVISQGKWLGFGDVKLAFFMGLFLGWPNILVALFAAFILGGIIGMGLVASRRKTMKSQVPFGPFLVSGTFIAMFFGGEIVRWYLDLLI